jgi:hypothetical protein
MASYKAGFDPPTRPGDTSRSRRQGTYMQPGSTKSEHREADIAHISGQMEPRRGQVPLNRPAQTGLPRPSMRDPSPSSRTLPETRPGGVAASRFGFGRSTSKPPSAGPAQELRGKSSRNVLRRKPSSISQQPESSRPAFGRSGSTSPTKWATTSAETRPSIEASLKSIEAYNDIFTRPRARAQPAKESPPIIPELDRYRNKPEPNASSSRAGAEVPHKLATQDLPPPTPLLSGTPVLSGGSSSHHRYSGYSGSGYSASPSTRYSESPGPGAYSRDTTPTSMSSQSPGILAPLKTTAPRLRQGSPALTRPPVSSVTRRRAGSNTNEAEGPIVDPQGLPSLRESLTSSSSNSTVKGEGKTKEKEKKKKKRLSPLPPSPPPRKSSQKFKKSPPREDQDSPSKPSQSKRSPPREEQDSPSKPSHAPAKPVMVLPSESSPLKPRSKPTTQPQSKTAPPVRPSREGAPDLQTQLGDSMAVIQSNLAGISFSQDRRRSALPRTLGTSPLLQSQLASRPQGIKVPSRNPSPSPVQPSPREATPAPSGLGIIPDLRPQQIPPSSRGTASRTPSPSIANSKPRFGLFGRRTKTAPEVPIVEKTARKGPAAGTGHEGYGRYGLRPRSNSTGGLGSGRDRSMSAASSSQESVGSTRAHDPFLLNRMSPVIIAGGGEIIENRNASSELTRSESNTSLLLGRPSMESKGSSTRSNLSHEVTRTTLWPSALPREPNKRASAIAAPKVRRPSDSSDDGIGKSSLAFRRSVQRLGASTSALHLPRSLNMSPTGVSPSMTSLDASILSDESQLDRKSDVERGRKAQTAKLKKPEKRQKSPRKWNFFHRDKSTSKTPAEVALPVAVGKPPSRGVPHYAMLDSSDEQQDVEDMKLEDVLRDAEVVELSNEELDALQFGNYKADLQRIAELQAAMAASLPEQMPAPVIFSSPEPLQVTPELQQREFHLEKETAPTRPSRLPQVGRIPKVISARPEATSPKSFSRPFARLSTPQPLIDLLSVDKQSVALGPSPPKPSTPEPQVADRPRDKSNDPSLRQSFYDSRSESTSTSHRDFLAFSPRKNSEGTTSSSGGMSFAGTTAVIPDPEDALEEDEVWDEYDDLIENDDTIKIPVSATSSHGVPFQYESYESRRIRKSKVHAKESPTLKFTPKIKEPEQDPSRRSILTSSSVYSADMSAKVKDAMAGIPSPTTPMSFADFFSGYGDRNNGDSAQKPKRSSQSSSRKSTSSSSRTRSLSGLMTITEQENSSPISQVNLRVGSMTVSKWLTFGHVLFSPAREVILQVEGTPKRHSILVIDGLGNGTSLPSL